MPRARKFVFGPYLLDTDHSLVTFEYRAEFEGSHARFIDTLEFPGVTREMWERVPEPLLASMFRTLSLILGIIYWKVHVAPELQIEGWSLTKEQADFWNELYTKGLGEFFYLARIDFRGLISFPYGNASSYAPSRRISLRARSLLAHGGGKDCIVSAEMLKERGLAFDLFSVSPTRMQKKVAETIARPIIETKRTWDPAYLKLRKEGKLVHGNPSISMMMFLGVLAALLHDYRYVIFSNEQSADIGNIEYLGMQVNHQWSKSTESELMIRRYLAQFVTPDIIPFSLVRQFTDAEMARRFSKYPQYFHVFSSCNSNFFSLRSIIERTPIYRPYWCKKCPKCAFMFACLAAFLPKDTVVKVFGADLFADVQIISLYERLLGLKGFKPFECVGTSEEMMVIMNQVERKGEFAGSPAIKLFVEKILPRSLNFSAMERQVFSAHGAGTIPEDFASRFGAFG